jgi:hypothetical protein
LSYKRQAASQTRHVDGARNGLQLGFPAIPMFVETSIAITQSHKKPEDFFLFPNRKISSKITLKTFFVALLHLHIYIGSVLQNFRV